jgi:adenylate kinase family enzyme
MIIHISGASGSGKSTLGNKLKEEYKNKVVIKDLDDLLFEFVIEKEKQKYSEKYILKNWKNDYQEYLDNFIDKQNENIIFVGLNQDIGSLGFRNKKITPPKAFYNVHADYKFYIDLPIEQILKQKFFRQISKIYNNKEKIFNKWLEYPDKTQSKLTYEINLSLWREETEKWNKLYKTKKYEFMTSEDIYRTIKKIIT